MNQDIAKISLESQFSQMRERLIKTSFWFPAPALISFALALILSGQLLPNLNPRLGSRANILNFQAEREKEGAIWLGIYPLNNHLILTTSDKKVFKLPLVIKDSNELREFREYLLDLLNKETVKLALNLDPNPIRLTAVLAVDEKLNFAHIRPLIYLLASVGISKYGFETKLHQEL